MTEQPSAARDDALARRGTSAHEAKSGELRHSEPRHASASSVGGRLPTAGGEDCPATGDSHAASDNAAISEGFEAVHGYFGLSYASWACFPRTLLQSMPDEWQARFVALMREYDERWGDLPEGFVPSEYRVQPVEDGKLAPWDNYRLPHYSRGRTRVSPDGTINGERFPR